MSAAILGLVGFLVLLAVIGLVQQARNEERSSAAIDALTRAVTARDQADNQLVAEIAALTETVQSLAADVKTHRLEVTRWARDVRKAEIETGVAALNRYVALASDASDRAADQA